VIGKATARHPALQRVVVTLGLVREMLLMERVLGEILINVDSAVAKPLPRYGIDEENGGSGAVCFSPLNLWWLQTHLRRMKKMAEMARFVSSPQTFWWLQTRLR
jgi:hypothetical protein